MTVYAYEYEVVADRAAADETTAIRKPFTPVSYLSNCSRGLSCKEVIWTPSKISGGALQHNRVQGGVVQIRTLLRSVYAIIGYIDLSIMLHSSLVEVQPAENASFHRVSKLGG